MAVCCAEPNAAISGPDGIDCCDTWYRECTTLSVVDTPVMRDSEWLTRSKVATPKSGCGVVGSAGGVPGPIGSTYACTLVPIWSNDRKNRSPDGPSVEGITVPSGESSWPLAAV